MIPYLILLLLQIADVGTTYEVLERGGKESNPLMRWFMSKIGVVPGLVIPKIAVMVALWFLIGHPAELFLYPMILVYVIVVTHNFLVLFRKR